jgi:hypothetical protein
MGESDRTDAGVLDAQAIFYIDRLLLWAARSGR